MQNIKVISFITLQVALALGESDLFNQIERFSKEATENEYTCFTHYSFFYSFPAWGKQWPSGKSCEFHRVYTRCHLCKHKPLRNEAGIGDINILNNGICNKEILVHKEWKIVRGKRVSVIEYIPNTPRLSHMILLCDDCVSSHFKWDPDKKEIKNQVRQLELF
ncbi:MAG: hypothetical protein ABIP68_02030 [Ferruginibacter sp.]